MRMLESQKPQTAKILIKAAEGYSWPIRRISATRPSKMRYNRGHQRPCSMEGHSTAERWRTFRQSRPEFVLRAHRSFLVNINHIASRALVQSSYQLRMDDKKQTEIPVSRAQTRRCGIVQPVKRVLGSQFSVLSNCPSFFPVPSN